MSLANVNITDTFDVWRVRTNQIIIALDENQVITNAAFEKANTGGTISYAAYDKANAANYFAYLVNANTVAAFDKANTGGSVSFAAFDKANSANYFAYLVQQNAAAAFAKANSVSGGAYYVGNNGRVGDEANGRNDIFRVNNNFISANLYFSDGENGSATGPLTVNTGYLVQINTGARVVII